jgi:general secretion pathway protein B
VAKLDVAQPPAAQPRIQEKAAQVAVEQDETEQIPLLWELPARIQERLSDLKINILVYNEDAADRFVIINMHKYREGDRLEPSGMRLERITRKGIVVDYGDGLVRL